MQWEAITAPDAVVRGALEAAKEFGVQIVLVGRGADILASMKAQGWDTLPDGVELANAEDVVDMHCDPAAVVKQHPNSSLVLGARMLAQGGGDAFISAGNTGRAAHGGHAARQAHPRYPPRGVLGRSFRRRTATPFSSMRARMPSARRNSCCSSAAWARSTRRRRSALSRRVWAF